MHVKILRYEKEKQASQETHLNKTKSNEVVCTSTQLRETPKQRSHFLSCELYLHPSLQAPHRGPSLPSTHSIDSQLGEEKLDNSKHSVEAVVALDEEEEEDEALLLLLLFVVVSASSSNTRDTHVSRGHL
jgi:hypothetical protein